jgi:RND family efflux transporter MFP subunit
MTAKRRAAVVRILCGGAAVLLAVFGLTRSNHEPPDSLMAVAKRATLVVSIAEVGTLRPSSVLTYRSRVLGRELEIVWLVPEGQSIKKNDLLIRFDPSELETELQRATQAMRQAQLDLQVAETERGAADATVTGFAGGKDLLDLEEARLNHQMAEAKVAQLKKDYAVLAPLVDKGFVTRDELERTALDVQQAENTVVIARRRLALMTEQTVPQQRQRASLVLAQRESQAAVARQRVSDATTQVHQLTDAIDSCTVRAERDGLVVYEENLSTVPRRKIRVGDRVTTSQGVVTIPEVSRMMADTSIREGDLHRIRPGQAAEAILEAFPGVKLSGKVVSVGTIARVVPDRPFDGKRFDVAIELSSDRPDLRPEMTARIAIQVAEVRDALVVPVMAVFTRGSEKVVHVFADGRVETRVVTVGQSNDALAEIQRGIHDGEFVLLVDRVGASTARAAPTAR